MRFVDPRNDLAFKKIFGSKKHKDILISFLNAVLDFKDEYKIINVKLENPYQVPKIPDLKETILDIKATNRRGDDFIVEMQKKDIGDFAKRSLYYTSKAYVSQLKKGEDYINLKKVYFIGIVDFKMFENRDFISRHLIINQETNTQDLNDFEFTFIELPKFNKEISKLETILDKWIYFIKHASDLDMIPEVYEDIREFKEAFEIAQEMTYNKEEMKIYEYILKKERDDISALNTAKRKGWKMGWEQGLEKGIEKGREEGIQKGIEKGVKKGKKEAQIEIIKECISQGLNDETISKITKVDIKEIARVREENFKQKDN